MRESKFNSIFNGLSAIAKKVYEAVPMQSPWDASQIHNELHRTGSTSCDFRIMRGCLDTLVKGGLVKEPTSGTFVRIAVDKSNEPQTKKPEQRIEPTMSTTSETPIEKIGKLASQANALLAMAKKLTADIETVAIEVEEMFSSRDAETAKLKQLQALLKSLG